MPILEIIKYPNPILKEVSAQVVEITPEISSFIDDMIETMREGPGCALAAVQFGRLERIIVVEVGEKFNNNGLVVLINPIIISGSGRTKAREGCLSIPEFTANIKRAKRVQVKGLAPDGAERIVEAEGFEARALQHELDHLDGILFIDRITDMKRDLFKRKMS
jgi:peptide deformylase